MANEPGLSREDRLLAVTTLSFDIAVLELLLPLVVGGQLILARSNDVYDGARLVNLIDHYDVTAMQATPATWRLMIEAGWSGSESLKALCGGEPLPLELANSLAERCDSLWNMYGPTETTIWSTISKIEEEATRISIGRPIANTEIYILDSHLEPVPIGTPGELFIGGDGLARGYLDRPELTSERFIDHPFVDEKGARLYRTGDLARYRGDGEIECLGRVDFQIKLRGFRIELGEIESVLEQFDGVEQAAVTTCGDGAAEKRLVAYVRGDGEFTPGDLRQHMRAHVPDYMVPFAYMQLDEFPLTPNGKIDRKALPDPDLDVSVGSDTTAPRTETERRLAEIWCEILGLASVGAHADFFDIGGHSLIAVRLTSRVLDAFEVKISLRDVFEIPVLNEQASRIDLELESYRFKSGALHAEEEEVEFLV